MNRKITAAMVCLMTMVMTSISTEISAQQNQNSNQPTKADPKTGYESTTLTEKQYSKYQKGIEKEGRKNNDPAYRKNIQAEDTHGVKTEMKAPPKKFTEEQTDPENGLDFMTVKKKIKQPREKYSEFSYGLKAGAVVAQLDPNDYIPRYGFTAGLFMDYKFSKHWSIAAELLYAEQGARTYEEYDVKGYWTRREITALNYVNCPVMIKFKDFIFKGVDLMAGAQGSYLVDSKTKFREPARFGTEDIIAGYKDYDLAVPMGISYTFPNKHIVIDARYTMGMMTITEEIPNAIAQLPEYKNNTMQITVGYAF